MTRLNAMRAASMRAVRTLGRGIAWLVVNLIGRWHWQAPAWFAWSGGRVVRGWRYLTANRTRASIAVALAVAAGGASFWYATRPQPDYVTYP